MTHEEWLKHEATKCMLCDRKATTAFWWREGVYTVHGFRYCDTDADEIRRRLKRDIRREPGQRSKIDWWDERTWSGEDAAFQLQILRQRYPAPKPDPWPYPSTVGVVA